MIQIQTLNAISPVYRDSLPEGEYDVRADAEHPQALLVRSANLHEMSVGDELLCIGRAGAGVNNIPLDKMAEKGVVVFNSPGANANAVKELVAAGLLLASRRITDGVEWCKTLAAEPDMEKLVEKNKSRFAGPELSGKTLGVIGLGAIGVLVANMGVALGMDVLGYDPYISVDHAWKLSRAVRHSTDFTEVLEKSDYLTLHVPLMDSTRNTIDEAALRRMKPTAALLNFARGPLVDAAAVRAALEEGRLRTYVSDFPSPELIGAKNVVVTPHLGASTPESEDNCVRMVARQIDDYLKNGSIVNSCNYPNCPMGRCVVPRITVLHQNVPNVIGAITQRLSSEGLNIENMVNQSRGALAYTVVDVSARPSEALIESLRGLETSYRVRLLMPQ